MEGVENKERLFGIKAVDARGKSSLFKSFFRIQTWKFWLMTYAFAIVVFYIFNITYYDFVFIVNVILFPFSAMFIGKVANFFKPSSQIVYGLLYPSHKKHLHSNNQLFNLVFILIKIGVFIVIWRYSFIIGIIGLIIVMNDVKNLSK
ncbi:MAG TPA: hypothetical protein VK077_09710 [Virgibacillus sp.]|nr:hypothetical protein [Virgibacillus sp.]